MGIAFTVDIPNPRCNYPPEKKLCPYKSFVADFACCEMAMIVEIDGGYHDYTYEDDTRRQQYLEEQGWRVLRFSNEEVIEDVEAVAIAIAKSMG